jgi:hypothetical protein
MLVDSVDFLHLSFWKNNKTLPVERMIMVNQVCTSKHLEGGSFAWFWSVFIPQFACLLALDSFFFFSSLVRTLVEGVSFANSILTSAALCISTSF